MADKAAFEIPYSQFEYRVNLTKPMINLVGKFQDVVLPFVDALAPFGFSFEDTEFQLSAAKPKDHVIIFQQPAHSPPPQMRVALKWSNMTVTVDQPVWESPEVMMSLCKAANKALWEIGRVPMASQQISAGLHVQPKVVPRSALTSGFLTPKVHELLDGKIIGQGVILHRENASIVIDDSAGFANALFIRIQRIFDGAKTIDEITSVLIDDTTKVWEVVGFEGEL